MANNKGILGIDVGGTNIRIGLIQDNIITSISTVSTPATEPQEVVLNTISEAIEKFRGSNISAIGIGVPSIVDVDKGIVYDVVNIPSWKEVHLKAYLEDKFHIPVFVNNDANCFVAGEKHYGKGKAYNSIAGLILGTGLGAGLIFNNKLYEGKNCGAGEIGNIPYLANNYEYYCSGQFFKNEYQIPAKEAYQLALEGDAHALEIFNCFGHHVGNMLQAVLYAYDPEYIILGGSVSKSFHLFQDSMYRTLQKFAYPKSLINLKIEISEIENIAVYGAASLFLDSQ